MDARSKRRLLKLADFLDTKVPRRLFNTAYWAFGPRTPKREPDATCQTSACAAGWATAIFSDLVLMRDGPRSNDWCIAHRKTGSQDTEALMEFFNLAGWDESEELFGTRQMTPKQKARQIRNFVKRQGE